MGGVWRAEQLQVISEDNLQQGVVVETFHPFSLDTEMFAGVLSPWLPDTSKLFFSQMKASCLYHRPFITS